MNFTYWLNTAAYTPLELTFALVGNVSWAAVYYLLIWNARRNNFMEMPLFIGAGNLAWEALYSFVFAEYINLGMAIVWGVRVWFFLDCYIFYLSVKTAPKDVSTPLLQRYIAPIGFALFIAWGVFIWAIVQSGLDNVPFGSSPGVVKLGGVSAYILNMGISLLFIAQYLRLYTTQTFSKGVAWLKMIGTAVTTIFFALIDPQNILLLTMGGIVFVADVSYIVLVYVLPSVRPSIIDESAQLESEYYTFPANSRFDELWAQNPEYLDFRGLRLRKLQLPHWHYLDETYRRESFVLEGVILCNTDVGDCTGKAAQNCTRLVDGILKEMDMYSQPLYFIDNGLGIGKVSGEARRNASTSFTTLFRGLHLFLVTTDLTRIAFRLIRPFSPETYRNWQLFGDFEDALTGMLTTHFMRSAQTVKTAGIATNVNKIISSQEMSYHEKRIDELYAILAKIEASDLENIPTPDIPSDDMYADIFKALHLVLEDKRFQIAQAHEHRRQLEEQAAQIQLANIELSFQNDSLMMLNREKNEIMGIVAHDLKNPIGAVRGLAELIESGFADAPKIPEIATQIVRTANRMLELVKNILDSNQLEEGAMPFHVVQVDLAPLVESVVWQYSPAAELKKITIYCEIDHHKKNSSGDSSTLAIADEQGVMQVFDNLLSNAVKYSPHGKNVFVRLYATASMVRFEVKDEGEGISANDMPKLFGKFARLSAQPTGGEHSTGLGLSIVKKMVEAMNGKVWCESETGKGATFIVELPLVRE